MPVGNRSKPKKSKVIVVGSGDHKYKELYKQELNCTYNSDTAYESFVPQKQSIVRKKRTGGHSKHRYAIYSRDGHKCLKCGSSNNLTLDHIRPVSKGGSNKFHNLQTLCEKCNNEKGANEIDYRSRSHLNRVAKEDEDICFDFENQKAAQIISHIHRAINRKKDRHKKDVFYLSGMYDYKNIVVDL